MNQPRTLGAETTGFEMQFACNHSGHFLLTNLIVPTLASGARVVVLSSAAHQISTARSHGSPGRPPQVEYLATDTHEVNYVRGGITLPRRRHLPYRCSGALDHDHPHPP